MKALKYFLLFVLLVSSGLSQAQTKESLESERKKLLNEIKRTNKMLVDSKQQQGAALERLQALNKQVSLRKNLIRTIDNEAVALQKEMNSNKSAIEQLEQELVQLKEEYAQLVFMSYKHRGSNDKLLYIFASDNLKQAWRRMSHMKAVAEYQEKQGERIAASKQEIVLKNEELLEQKKEKLVLLDSQKAAKRELEKDKREADALLETLKGQEQDLKKRLEEQQKKRKQLDRKIRELLEKEIKPGGFKLSPEEKLVSKTFVKNKGGLPWPVEKGVLIGRFGTHPHPVLPGVEVTNNGIDIATDKGADVRSIFEGEVTGIIDIPGNGLAVVVKHGGYRTVYANLKETYVEKGQVVETKQDLGRLLTEGDRSVAHLEVWQITSEGMKKSDPQKWIAR